MRALNILKQYILFVSCWLACQSAFAIAGSFGSGGGGSSFSGGGYSYSHSYYGSGSGEFSGVFVLILCGIFVCIVIAGSLNSKKKYKRLQHQYDALKHQLEGDIAAAAKQDPLWQESKLRLSTSQAFYKIQAAWEARDQNIAKSYMSDKLFAHQKNMTDTMLEADQKNILDDLELTEIQILAIHDNKNDSLDKFWALLNISVIDYWVNSKTLQHVRGDQSTAVTYTQLWRFVRQQDRWVVDNIDQMVTPDDLQKIQRKSGRSSYQSAS